MPTFELLKIFGVALGIGLLIGAERERRKSERAVPAVAGIRTFATAALIGALAMYMGGAALFSITLACVGLFTAVSYWRSRNDDDPGLTTEFALIAVVILGGLSLEQPSVAAATAVVLTILLAIRRPMHRFVGDVMTEGELADVLILAGAVLVILPLLPDRDMGPFNAINPYKMWLVAVLILGINAVGRVLTRWLGARLGVPLLGLASGFISSSATIGAMGAWARGAPQAIKSASAAAVLSTIATFVQLAIVLHLANPAVTGVAFGPILSAILMALFTGAALTAAAWRSSSTAPPDLDRRVGIALALVFSATLGAMLILVAALRDWFGEPGLLLAAAIGGALDVHAASIAVASQVAAGKLPITDALLPLLVAWTSSAAAKMVFALTAGPRAFAARVIPAQAMIILAAWLAAWLLDMI